MNKENQTPTQAKFDYRRLRAIRERQPRKVTQQDVAEGTGIGRGNYSKKENGDVPTTLDEIERLAAFYGISAAEFFLTPEEIDRICSEYKRLDLHGQGMQAKIEEAFTQVMKLLRQIDQRDEEIRRLQDEVDKLKRKEG